MLFTSGAFFCMSAQNQLLARSTYCLDLRVFFVRSHLSAGVVHPTARNRQSHRINSRRSVSFSPSPIAISAVARAATLSKRSPHSTITSAFS